MTVAVPVTLLNNDVRYESSPATAALEASTRRMMSKVKRQSNFESKTNQLACDFCEMSFKENVAEKFPAIVWDSDEDNLSDSDRSLSDWNAFLYECDGNSSLGKRGRECRPLVRSKKIKSDLSSLASSFVSRSA